jgi:hypothetical protein
VSYSHKNAQWLERWQMMSKPMAKANGMEFWSDTNLQPGKWEQQIQNAMHKSEAVVLLVSPAFIASEFIMNRELPYFLTAYETEKKQVFWLLLEPCDMRHHPARRIKEFQAITDGGNLKPLSALRDADWQRTMVRGCEMIDDYLREKERPVIHPKAKSKPTLKEITPDFELLEKPPRRRVEVLVYGGGKWWRQGGINPGSTKIRIKLGDAKTKSGTEFKVVAITTDEPLTKQTYPNLPNYRTKVDITLKRA